MTDQDLDRLEALANAATKGPWTLIGGGEYVTGVGVVVAPDDGGVTPEDAEFIAHARTDVPALIAEVERLRAQIERVRGTHKPVEIEPSDTICGQCSNLLPNGRYLPIVEYPCPTIKALEGSND